MDPREMMTPEHTELRDILVRGSGQDWIPIDPEGRAFAKPLWTSPDSGGWAVLYNWKAGFVAPAHKHLGAIHAYVISGRLKLRDYELAAGDYVYEPNGIIHEETTAVEDTVHLNIADGPVLFFDDSGITQYFGWEQIEQLRLAGEDR